MCKDILYLKWVPVFVEVSKAPDIQNHRNRNVLCGKNT
jgi:hypothetical protein